MKPKRVPATQGGCWFCETEEPDSGWLFSQEWDANLHGECLKKAVKMNYKTNEYGIDVLKIEFKEFLSET